MVSRSRFLYLPKPVRRWILRRRPQGKPRVRFFSLTDAARYHNYIDQQRLKQRFPFG